MPQWLQTVLIIAAVLAAMYLFAVIVQIIMASIFRRQAEPVRISIEHAQRDIGNARAQLDALTPAINTGTKEMPFGPLYDQARDLLKKGLASMDELQRRVSALAAQQIPEQPIAAAFKLAPMTREVAQRIGERKSAKTVSVQLTEVNDTLTRIKHIQEDIEALPAREKDALLQLQKHAAEASVAVEAEARPKLPLAEARDALRQASAYLGEADKLLAIERPPQPAVIIAHPLRVKADQQLQAVDKLVGETKDKRTNAEAAIAESDRRLATLRAAIAEEEAGGLPRPQFNGNIDQLDYRAAAVRGMIEQGEYGLAAGALVDLEQGITSQQDALDALKQARAQVMAMLDNASQRLTTLTQWINETPQTFDLDITRAASQQLQDTDDRLRGLILHEDIAVMSTASDLNRQIEDVFRRATNVHNDFVAGRHRFDALSATLNEFSVQAEASQARQVASELSKANQTYWDDLAPEKITAAADDLAAGWQSISGLVIKVKESELTDVLARMDDVQVAYLAANDLHGAAVKSLTRLDGDKLQANTALNDDVMTRLLDEADAIVHASPSTAGEAGVARGRVEQLRGEMATPAPDYATLNANAQRLRQELDAFVGGYQTRLQETHAQLESLTTSLKAALGTLHELQNDPLLDFAVLSETVQANATAWLTANEDASLRLPLDAAQAALTEGQTIERDASALLGQAGAFRSQVTDKRATAQAALAEVNGMLSAAQAGLQALTDVGSDRWGAAMLAGARQPMTEALALLATLEQPASERSARRLTPDQMSAVLACVDSLTIAARQRANDTQAEIAQRTESVKQQQVALSHAYEMADTFAQDHPERQAEWKDVRQNITQLEQRWMNASSFAEALGALTQAVHEAEAFSALASTSSA